MGEDEEDEPPLAEPIPSTGEYEIHDDEMRWQATETQAVNGGGVGAKVVKKKSSKGKGKKGKQGKKKQLTLDD